MTGRFGADAAECLAGRAGCISRMSLHPLPADWSDNRETLRRIATHVLAQARKLQDNLFDLEPSIGGFATPSVGPARQRVRVSGDLLVVECAIGPALSELKASTTTVPISGSTLGELCAAVGFEPSADFSAGPDTPPLGDLDAPISLDPAAADALGEWYLLGRRAIDIAVASIEEADATLGRLWPEHFDYGIDLGIDLTVGPGGRVNLGAAAGDSFHDEPYLYVGPWDFGSWEHGPAGPGDYWNAPFGAVLAHAEIASSSDPVDRAATFLLEGIGHLRGK